MQTYNETQTGDSFDWGRTLRNLKRRTLRNLKRRKTNITDDVYNKLIERSANRVTCACGNMCNIIPRKICGEPIDCELANLVENFHVMLYDQKWNKAAAILRNIERRYAALVNAQIVDSIKLLDSIGYKVDKK